jgi:hypothetical protein
MKLEGSYELVAAEEYERSGSEELTQCVYSKIETVIIDCKFCLVYNQYIEHKIQNPLITDALPG